MSHNYCQMEIFENPLDCRCWWNRTGGRKEEWHVEVPPRTIWVASRQQIDGYRRNSTDEEKPKIGVINLPVFKHPLRTNCPPYDGSRKECRRSRTHEVLNCIKRTDSPDVLEGPV